VSGRLQKFHATGLGIEGREQVAEASLRRSRTSLVEGKDPEMIEMPCLRAVHRLFHISRSFQRIPGGELYQRRGLVVLLAAHSRLVEMRACH
jgi:hypothetical protein